MVMKKGLKKENNCKSRSRNMMIIQEQRREMVKEMKKWIVYI